MNTDNIIYGIFLVCFVLNFGRWIVCIRKLHISILKFTILGFLTMLALSVVGMAVGSFSYDAVYSRFPKDNDFYRYFCDTIATLVYCAVVSIPTHYILKALTKRRERRTKTDEIDLIGSDSDL